MDRKAPAALPARTARAVLAARSGLSGPNGPGSSGQGEFFGLAGDGAPSRGPKIALFSVLAVVVLFAVYALIAWGLSDKAPRETTVAGVDVGGMTQTQAADRDDRAAGRADQGADRAHRG